MAQPVTRQEFKDKVLRAIGAPVLSKSVIADTQVEDQIDNALTYYWSYHYNGSEKLYYKHQLTANNIAEGYITTPENIIGAVRIFAVGSHVISSQGMFNINYQIALNDLWAFQNNAMLPLYMVQSQIQFMQQMLAGQANIRYNRHRDRLELDIDWSKVKVGDYIIVEAYEVVDPELFPDVWGDRWLQEYAIALVKKQIGINLSRYEGVQLLGGVTLNGRQMLDDANAEIDDLKNELQDVPPEDFIA